MPTHGKNYRKSLEGVDLTQRFSVEDAVAKSLGASFAKFDETVDVALRLGVDPKYSDQMVRGAVSLPHGLGKTVRVVKLNGEGAIRRRIMDMGLTKGVAVKVRKLAPLGDPMELTVRGYELSLRKADAEMIEVE